MGLFKLLELIQLANLPTEILFLLKLNQIQVLVLLLHLKQKNNIFIIKNIKHQIR